MEDKPVKIVSWNVNGIRAALNKDMFGSLSHLDADIIALQETKLQDNQITEEMRHLKGYDSWWSCATVKKGYSGVSVYSRLEPLRVEKGIGVSRFDEEGRILGLHFKDFVFFNIYFPNGQMSDDRLSYKLDFYEAFFSHTDELKKEGKSIIICGDFNTAHNEIDLKHPQANKDRSGFLRIERDVLDKIIAAGYVDTFRYLYPETVKYSWWTYRYNARKNNAGWRIDYFFVTRDLIEKGMLKDAFIANDIQGSDHCPVGMLLQP